MANVPAPSVALTNQPADPDWDELARFARDDDCTTGVITPTETFNFRHVLRLTPPNWQMGTVSHTFCRYSAQCTELPGYLSGVTRLNQTMSIYLTNFASSNPFFFGHMNVTKHQWDNYGQFHIRTYSRVNDETLQEQSKYEFQAQKRRYVSGPQNNQEFWKVFRRKTFPGNPPIPANIRPQILAFAQSFETYLNNNYP